MQLTARQYQKSRLHSKLQKKRKSNLLLTWREIDNSLYTYKISKRCDRGRQDIYNTIKESFHHLGYRAELMRQIGLLYQR